MAVIRYVRVFEDDQLVAQEPYEVSDAQLADEARVTQLAKLVVDPLAGTWTLDQMRAALVLLMRHLQSRGLLG